MTHDPRQLDLVTVAIAAAAATYRLSKTLPSDLRHLGDQMKRSSTSAPLNIQEGLGRTGRAARSALEIAYAEAGEAAVAVRTAQACGVRGGDEALELLDRVRAMAYRRLHPRR